MLMVAEHGSNYQVVDDSGGDSGLDGLKRDTGELHAIYCPVKPASRDYLRKIQSDIEKAARLRNMHGYDARIFVFITPQPLREPTLRELRKLAREHGFLKGVSLSGEYLEALLRKHNHLLNSFPDLSYPRVHDKLNEIAELLQNAEGRSGQDAAPRKETPTPASPKEPAIQVQLFEDQDYEELEKLELRLLEGDESALYELEQYRLETDDPIEELLAALIEIDYELKSKRLDRVFSLAIVSAEHAKKLGRSAEESVFRGKAAAVLAMQAALQDIDLAAEAVMSLNTGINLIDLDQAEARHRRIVELYSRADQEIKTALSLAYASRNLEAVYHVLTATATCEVYKAIPYEMSRYIGKPNERLPYAKQVVETLHQLTIKTARLIRPSLLVAAYHDYANSLLTLDDPERAHAHALQALSLAQKHKLESQAEEVQHLLELIEFGLEERKKTYDT